MTSPRELTIGHDDDGVRVDTAGYRWTWTRRDDRIVLTDPAGRTMLSGPLQPAVVVRPVAAAPADGADWAPGDVDAVAVDGARLLVGYRTPAGHRVEVRWRFDAERCWIEPVVFHAATDVDVVALHYFADGALEDADGSGDNRRPAPGLRARYLVHPGICGSAAMSPLIQTQARLDTTTWLGRGGGGSVHQRQQWGLPVHYVAGLDSTVHPVEIGAMTARLSAAFCLGWADLPAGDLLLRFHDQRFAPVVQLRGDLWGHLRGPGSFELGATMVLTFGADYSAAIRAYQRALVETGAITLPDPSPAKRAAATAAQFNTWGAQLAAQRASHRFDQEALERIHAQLVDSGLEVGMFVVDDKWEGEYGALDHDPRRFPNFEAALDAIRAHGHRIGLWAALLRCDDPASLGLTKDDLLRGVDGAPVVLGPAEAPYFLFDVTRPGVRDVLRARIASFVARYRPALVKFDFGYEIPDLSQCAPADPTQAGERLLRLALEVVVSALRAADPDIVVMYYGLSPLLVPLIDLHGLDDPWMNAQEYHVEANRRLFFSRHLAELGMPTYGSGGYDWVNQIDIWFDSVVCGPLGSLGSFAGDLSDSVLSDRHVAVHNGLRRLTREATRFRVEAIGASGLGPVTGARSSSWVRIEDGEPVLVVLRPDGFVGAPGVSEYDRLVTTDVAVAVGSLEPAGLATARHLGVVPRGRGELVLRSVPAEVAATIVVHTVDGAARTSTRTAGADGLRVPLATTAEGVPVSWIELRF